MFVRFYGTRYCGWVSNSQYLFLVHVIRFMVVLPVLSALTSKAAEAHGPSQGMKLSLLHVCMLLRTWMKWTWTTSWAWVQAKARDVVTLPTRKPCFRSSNLH